MIYDSPLMTHDEAIRLIEPDVERDARYGVDWLSGEVGKKTLLSMGNAPEEIGTPSLETQRQRVKDFIERPDQLNWMIEFDAIKFTGEGQRFDEFTSERLKNMKTIPNFGRYL